jgi:hypothetical protein
MNNNLGKTHTKITDTQIDELREALIRASLLEEDVLKANLLDWLLEVILTGRDIGLNSNSLYITNQRFKELNDMANAYGEHCSADLSDYTYSELLIIYWKHLDKLNGLKYLTK